MKILWISNIVFPEADELLGKKGRCTSSGGWMVAAAQALIKKTEIQLAIAAPSIHVHNLQCLEGRNIKHYVFPLGKGNRKKNSDYKEYFLQINHDFTPDITHIHGTEYSHGLAYIDACCDTKVVVSIQGMISIIAKYYNYGLTFSDIIRNITPKDVINGSLFRQKRLFERRGRYEIELLKRAHHVVGRTTWDRSHVWAINQSATYHFCNETLRDAFYSGCWSYENCSPHSVFLSQASYPLKGFHQLLKALPLVLRVYPDVQVRVAGEDFTKYKSTLKQSGYSKYIVKLIKGLGLQKHITFLGPLDSDQMKQEYLSANVFVCPSSIENSSNSIGEAQMLGVPCVVSYVGGAADMVPNDLCGTLYRFEEVEMLAKALCEQFDASIHFDNSSMRKVAAIRHDREANTEKLISIYYSIVNPA